MRAGVAIDLSDSLDAAERIEFHLSGLLRTDPSTKKGADRALTHAAAIGVWAFNELRYHVVSLQRGWESKIENHIARLPRKRRTGSRAA